jgi:hypothetical protein
MNHGQVSSLARPATPVPHKRPASWGKIVSLEAIRPKKKSVPHDVQEMNADMMQQVPNIYGEAIPATMAMGYDLPLRLEHDQMLANEQHMYANHHHAPMQIHSPTTFFFDDADVRFG